MYAPMIFGLFYGTFDDVVVVVQKFFVVVEVVGC